MVNKKTKGYTKSVIDLMKVYNDMKKRKSKTEEHKNNLTIEYVKEYGIWPLPPSNECRYCKGQGTYSEDVAGDGKGRETFICEYCDGTGLNNRNQ